ncbi:Ankyrin repeats (many copies) [Mactra antiquata]
MISLQEEGARDNTVRLLLRHGADVNATDDCGRTALSYVCERRCNDILRILIKEHNIDPDIGDTNGNTPLIYSAMVGNDIACDILIRHFRRLGLNIEAMNDEGFTALLMASKHGNITCAQILLGQGKALLTPRDNKYGLSVEEWLAKKGFTLQDIKPVRQDGKGRSRFVKLANIAAICSAPKKHLQQTASFGEMDYINNFQLGKLDDEETFLSDATTGTDFSAESISRYLANYNDRYNDLELDIGQRHYKIYPLNNANSKPKVKTTSTQTTQTAQTTDKCDNEDGNGEGKEQHVPALKTTDCDAQTDITVLNESKVTDKRHSSRKGHHSISPDRRATSKSRDDDSSNKRFSLPEIEHTPMISRPENGGKSTERKNSLDVLPEKLIASIELGDGRRHSIQLYPDSSQNKIYWTPVSDEMEGEMDGAKLPPFERRCVSVSDSETSTNDDGAIF